MTGNLSKCRTTFSFAVQQIASMMLKVSLWENDFSQKKKKARVIREMIIRLQSDSQVVCVWACVPTKFSKLTSPRLQHSASKSRILKKSSHTVGCDFMLFSSHQRATFVDRPCVVSSGSTSENNLFANEGLELRA